MQVSHLILQEAQLSLRLESFSLYPISYKPSLQGH